jgi:hypothetical protein
LNLTSGNFMRPIIRPIIHFVSKINHKTSEWPVIVWCAQEEKELD